MPVEIINTASKSIIRAVEAGSYTVSMANLSSNIVTETVSSASIKKIAWSTNGSITLVRNSVPILSLYNSGEMKLVDMGYTIANNASAPIVITITTGGSLVMELNKDSEFL